MLDANTASASQLASVPGVTPALARSLTERRPFLTMAEFDAWLSASLNQEQRQTAYRRVFLQINLNSASHDELLLVPGMTTSRVATIAEARPFRSLVQFRQTIGSSGDGQEFARLEPFVFVPINLNTASDADILSLPGMGQRMLREFKEYRPYKAIEQFRREIRKYVNDKEVARLERYVTVN